jgi:hypothetical protein
MKLRNIKWNLLIENNVICLMIVDFIGFYEAFMDAQLK